MEIYVARQPIFDANQNVEAYELLFRSGKENTYPGVDGDMATAKIISNSFQTDGLEDLTKGKKAYINFTRKHLIDEAATSLPPSMVVVEVLETIEPEQDVIDALKRLKEKGYTIALDDFVFNKKFEPFIKLADIIKVDFTVSKPLERKEIVEKYKHTNIKFLAEKIESHYDFEEAKSLGYSLFQGYFFCEPEVIQGKDIPGYKYKYLDVLAVTASAKSRKNNLFALIRSDKQLELRFNNIVQVLYKSKVRQSTSLEGTFKTLRIMDIKKCLYALAVFVLGKDRPEELTLNGLIRAKFSEYLSGELMQKSRSDYFFEMGLFSILDVLIGRPMVDILERVPLEKEIKSALLGEENLLRKAYEVVLSYENGQWDRMDRATSKINLREIQYPRYYLKAVEWANQLIKAK